MEGNLIIISSPSGGGKGTLIREVLKSASDITFSVSYTTRSMRQAEENGREYFFIDRPEFERLIAAGEFLEHAEVHGNLYGTSLSQVRSVMASGKDVLLEIDVQGASILHDKVPDAVSIFILPPSFEVLRTRLTARGTESGDELAIRLRNAFDEVQRYEDFRFVVVNNVLETAVAELQMIIASERHRTDRQKQVIRDILDGFDAERRRFEGE